MAPSADAGRERKWSNRAVKVRAWLAGLMTMLAASASAQVENRPFVVNAANLRALAGYTCSGLANIQTDSTFRARLLLHRFSVRAEGSGRYRLTGECSRELVSASRALAGKPLELLFDAGLFAREDKPVMIGHAGDWTVKFYFETRATFEGGDARFQKELARMTLSNSIPDSLEKLLPKGTSEAIADGLERINASSLSFLAQWSDPARSRDLRVEATGHRWLIALTAWQSQEALLMNGAPLVHYWGQGRGRPSGDKGNAVYVGQDEVRGCSYFSDRETDLLSAEACLRLWAGIAR